VVCTPFRAQATLLQRGLADRPHLRVGTIHKMQGQEADVCIFDPAQAGHPFLTSSPEAPRLVNVGASRARRALVICNSPAYLARNPLLMAYVDRAKLLG
jgi:superfamily I DNA and/or RNA helicase